MQKRFMSILFTARFTFLTFFLFLQRSVFKKRWKMALL